MFICHAYKLTNGWVTNKKEKSSLSVLVRCWSSWRSRSASVHLSIDLSLVKSTGGMNIIFQKGYSSFDVLMMVVERNTLHSGSKSSIGVQLDWNLVTVRAIAYKIHFIISIKPLSDSSCPVWNHLCYVPLLFYSFLEFVTRVHAMKTKTQNICGQWFFFQDEKGHKKSNI